MPLPEGFTVIDEEQNGGGKGRPPAGFQLLEGAAQKMGKTKGTVFGEVTGGREPGVESVSPLGLAGEMIRRTANVPSQLISGTELYPPGSSFLPAQGLHDLVPQAVRDFGAQQLAQAIKVIPLFRGEGALNWRDVVSAPTQEQVDIAKGLGMSAARGLEQIATPENAAIAGGVMLAPEIGLSRLAAEKLVESYFLPQIVAEGLPQALGKASVEIPHGTPQQSGEALGGVLGQGLMAAGIGGAAFRPEMAPSPGPRPEFTVPTTGDVDEIRGRVPPERQIEYLRPGKVREEQARQQAEQQARPKAPSFFGTPKGQVIPAEQMRTAEIYEGMQPKPPAGLLYPPPIQMGPTELPQTLENVGRQLRGEQVEAPAPGTRVGEPQPPGFVPPNKYRSKFQPLTKDMYVPPPEIKMFSGLGNPEEFRKFLRPAIEVGGKILYGEQGDTHADVLLRNGINPESIPHSDPRRGFVDARNPDTLINRKTAEAKSGLKGTADAGGLDSMDLPGAAQQKLMREYEQEQAQLKGEQPNAIRELRTGSIPETQSPRDIQTVEQKVRQGAGEQGEARKGQETQVPGQEGVQKGSDARKRQAYYGRGIDDRQTSYYSGLHLSPEDLKKAVKVGLNYASAKIGEGIPKLVYRLTKEGDAEEITDQHELGRAIEMAGEKHYWMRPNGKMFKGSAPDNTHYLAAKKMLREEADPESSGHEPGSDLRATMKKMREKGYAKVIEQDDAVYVVGKASEAQIQAAKALADKGKKELYVGGKLYVPRSEAEFDPEMQAGGTLEDVDTYDPRDFEDMQRDEGYGPQDEERYYSGFLDPERLIPGIKPAKNFIDNMLGISARRPGRESWDYLKHKTTIRTVPRTVAADEGVANKLVEAASTDITSAIQGLTTADAKKEAKRLADELFHEYEDAGLGMKPVSNQAPPPSFVSAKVGHRPIWVRKDLKPELEQAFDPKTRVEDSSVVSFLLDTAVESQIWGGTDFVWHMANMTGSLLFGPGKSKTALGDVILNIPGVNLIDFIPRVSRNLRKVILNEPATKARLAELSKLGAIRGVGIDAGIFKGIIETFDRAGRLSRDEMYDNLVKQGARDTAVDRREFINKMGQYNERLMSRAQSLARSYFSQFVVAGRTFNYNALNKLMTNDAVRAANPEAAAKFRVVQAANLFTAILAIPIAINMYTTKKPFGRPGTDVGAIDTGKDGPDGRPIQIDPLQLLGLRRGFRITGAQAVIRGISRGDSLKKTAFDAAKDIAVGMLHPWMGPPGRVVYTYFSGKDISGYKVSNDGDDNEANFYAALSQVNPVAASFLEGQKSGVGGGRNVLERTAAAVGYKKGKYPTHQQLIEKEQGQAPEQMDLGDRILAEQEHAAKVEKERMTKPPGLRYSEELQASQKAQKNIEKRGKELLESMPKADQQWLTSRGLIMRGYDNKFTMAKQKVYLTEDEMARYTDLIKENTSAAMDVLRENYDNLEDDKSKNEFFNEIMSAARGAARQQLEVEMAGKSVPKKKAKRFSFFQPEGE